MKSSEKLWQIILFAICIVYILLRLQHLTDSCLWFDEIFSIHAAEHDWQNLFRFVAQDLIHPPLFYVLLKIWILTVGESLFQLRFFPVLFSIISLIPFYLLCRQLKLNYPTIALAFSFFAANGSLIKYAQEVRMYSVLLCLSLFSLWLFLRFLNLGKGFFILTTINILLVYTHYFGWFVIVSEVFAVLIFQRIKIRQILTMFIVTAASFAPWIFAVWRAAQTNADFSQNLAWASKPNLTTVLQFIFNLLEPFYYQQTNIDPSSNFFITVPLLLIVILAFIFYLTNRKNESEVEKRNFQILLFFGFAPVLFAFVASWILPFSVWGTRHFIIVFAPFMILTAYVFDKLQILYLKLAVFVLIFWLFAIAFVVEIMSGAPILIQCAWENLASDLRETEQNSSKPTKVFVFEDAVAYDFWFTLRDREKQFQIIKVKGIPELLEDTAYFLPRGFDAVRTADENGLQGERFFVAFRDTEWNETKPPLRNLIEKGYKIGEPQIFTAQGLKAFLVEVQR